MKKHYMKTMFDAIEQMEEEIEQGEDPSQSLQHLKAVFIEGRSLWWKDDVRTFNAVRKVLHSFYCQAWSSKFEETARLTRALRFFSNQILDQFVLGGDEAERCKNEQTKAIGKKP